VWEGWKKLSGDNKLGVWEKIESKWYEYVDETRGKQSRTKKNKSNLEDKDVDPPPDLPCVPTGLVGKSVRNSAEFRN
jgi:hypothetical protein